MKGSPAVVALLALSASGAAWPAQATADPCPGFALVAGQGPSCPVPGGWEVLLPGGGSVFTHGPDPASHLPEVGLLGGPPMIPPVCVDPSTEEHGYAIYAVPITTVDRYLLMEGVIRDMVHQVNGKFRTEAWDEFGVRADYKFRCSAGEVEVAHAVLPTPGFAMHFGTIVSDLRGLGYDDPSAKYWVWLDGDMGTLGGQGTIDFDDQPTADNANNRGPDYGITYGKSGAYGVLVMMHENGHNLGAVQLSAPHTSGAFHCNDGSDVMCYDDGGPSSNFQPGVCSDRGHFDCGHDDYFHPRAPSGSYLATHWNLGSGVNRFLRLEFGGGTQAPVMGALSCSPAPSPPTTEAGCTLQAADDSTGVRYTVDWGDGVVESVPGGSYASPSQDQTARHAWQSAGNYTVTVTATDNGVPQMTSAPLTWQQEVAGCGLRASGQILLGAYDVADLLASKTGATVIYVLSAQNVPIPANCVGKAFTLSGSLPLDDFDVCWKGPGTATLRCDTTPGPEAGGVPEGSIAARVLYRTGAAGSFILEIG